VFALLLACAEPFDVSRDVLGPYRIAAIGVEDGLARAAIWSGDMAHDEPPVLRWTLDGQDLGEGWDVAVDGEGELELEVTSPWGDVHLARVSAKEPPSGLVWWREAVVIENESVEVRRITETRAVDGAVAPGESTRIKTTTTWGTAHWMSDTGALLPLDQANPDDFEQPAAADVLGNAHVLLFARDGEGGNRWAWIDAAVSEGKTFHHSGRILPGDVPPGLVAATLEGARLVDLVPVDDLDQQDALDCALPDVPFELDWLTEGRCALSEVDGARVVVKTW